MNILPFFSVNLDLEGYNRGYGQCVFDPFLRYEELCHLNSNSEKYKNNIKKRFNCNSFEAQFFMDFPLINVVPGSKKWNGTDSLKHKVGTFMDVVFISDKVIRASKNTILDVINDIKNIEMLEFIDKSLEGMMDMIDKEFEEKVELFREIHKEYRRFLLC